MIFEEVFTLVCLKHNVPILNCYLLNTPRPLDSKCKTMMTLEQSAENADLIPNPVDISDIKFCRQGGDTQTQHQIGHHRQE